jgi:hypothetical protein
MNREQVLQSVLDGQLLLDEPMSRHTTLKVGGPAPAPPNTTLT